MLKKVEQWLDQQKNNHLLRLACLFAEELSDPTLKENLVEKGLAIASELKQLRCDNETLAAALIYPAFTHKKSNDVLNKIDSVIIKLLIGVCRMDTIDHISLRASEFSQQKNFIDNLRKMLLAMVDDIRIVLIKLAERLVTLRLLRYESHSLQKDTAQKVMNLYAPLANRLGIGQLKWQMEDLAFRYLDPDNYCMISKSLKKRRIEREKYISDFIQQLEKLFLDNHIKNFNVSGRAKHIYSIYRKIQRKQVDFSQIYDTSAVRILVCTLEDCYTILGIVHSLWQPISKEFDDYIAKPKDNGYRSIHTAIIGPESHNLEIQIRTYEMHEQSELGVAAHWKYKEGKKIVSDFEEKISWLRELIDWQKEISPSAKWQKVFESRVYVFTPSGDVIDLEAGATPLDFAYHIHTEVGHRCRGAKVNGKMSPLIRALKTGDCVEILTAKEGYPSRDWLTLGYLKTRQAKSKVRHWFYKKDRESQVAAGEAIWEKEYPKTNFPKQALNQIYSSFNLTSVTDLLAAIGAGDIGIQSVLNRLRAQKKTSETQTFFAPIVIPQTKISSSSLEGMGNLLTQLARCCQPIPGDPITGYITQGRGITIHRKDCFNIKHILKYYPQRVIIIQWDESLPKQQYPVDVRIIADNQPDIIRYVTNTVNNEKISILGLNSYINKVENHCYISLTIEIPNLESLDKVFKSLQKNPQIFCLKRKR